MYIQDGEIYIVIQNDSLKFKHAAYIRLDKDNISHYTLVSKDLQTVKCMKATAAKIESQKV